MPAAKKKQCEDCSYDADKKLRKCKECGMKVCEFCWNNIHSCSPNHAEIYASAKRAVEAVRQRDAQKEKKDDASPTSD